MAPTTSGRKRVPGPRRAEKAARGVHLRQVPHVALPHAAVPHMSMPTGSPGRMRWRGGLAAVAAPGVVDRPVAAVAGSCPAEQYARQQRPHPDGER